MSTTSNVTRKLNILVVDDDQAVADSLVQVLNMVGFNAIPLYSGSDAVEQATQKPYDVLISDVVMAGMTGIDAAIEICKVLPNCKVLLISGNIETSDLLMAAHDLGHDFDILAKPFHPSEIIDRLNAMT
jgi:DNA-binding response OmpR family regulator